MQTNKENQAHCSIWDSLGIIAIFEEKIEIWLFATYKDLTSLFLFLPISK